MSDYFRSLQTILGAWWRTAPVGADVGHLLEKAAAIANEENQ